MIFKRIVRITYVPQVHRLADKVPGNISVLKTFSFQCTGKKMVPQFYVAFLFYFSYYISKSIREKQRGTSFRLLACRVSGISLSTIPSAPDDATGLTCFFGRSVKL